MRRGLLMTAAILVAVGCAHPPARQAVPESVAVPEDWSAPAPNSDPGAEWWKSFGSAELDGLIAEALERNHDLQAAAARVEAAEAEARIAGAALLPAVEANFDAQRAQRAFVGLPIPGLAGGVLKSRSTSYGLGLVSSWELDVWGRIRAGKRAALAELEGSQAEYAGARLSLTAQTAKVWLAVTEAQLQEQLAEKNLGTYQTTAEEVRARYERGIRSPLDVRLALANEASARATLAERRTVLTRARRQLEILRGEHPAGKEAGGKQLPDAPAEIPAGLPSELLARRPDIIQAERRLAANVARAEQARAALFPRIALTASAGTTTAELSDLLNQDFSVWSLAANVAQPIFQGGRLRASLAQSQARAREASSLYASSVLNAFREVESGLAAEQFYREREARLHEAVEHSRAAAALAEDRYRSGLEDFITVLEAQRRSAEAESLALAVRRQRLDNRVDLHLALGGGFPETKVASASPSMP